MHTYLPVSNDTSFHAWTHTISEEGVFCETALLSRGYAVLRTDSVRQSVSVVCRSRGFRLRKRTIESMSFVSYYLDLVVLPVLSVYFSQSLCFSLSFSHTLTISVSLAPVFLSLSLFLPLFLSRDLFCPLFCLTSYPQVYSNRELRAKCVSISHDLSRCLAKQYIKR